jgi:anti-anti-sigma regulatory factor
LHDAISALLQTHHPRWIVDVTGLTVCDRGGLRALNTAHHRSLRHHRKVTLLGASSTLQRALVRLRLEQPQHASHDVDQPVLTER